MKFALYLFPFILTVPVTSAAADTLTDLLPPETKVVFGIRVHNLAISSVAQTFAAQAQTAAAGWLKAVPLDGINFLRDIDEVLITTSGKGKKPPAVIVVTGRFDVPRLTAGAKQFYHNVPLLTGESQGDALVAVLDSGTVILGDAGLVRAAIDQRGARNKIDPALNDRITSLRQRYDIWGIGEQAEGFTSPVREAKVLESVDRFQFGMQLASGLELGAEIHARSPKDIEKLHDAFAMIAGLLKGRKSGSAAKFDLQVEGGSLKLNMYIPDAELRKTIQAETAALSPVSIPAPADIADLPETGPSGGPATPPVPPAALQPAAKPASAKVIDQVQDTVVFRLPGKKDHRLY